MRKVAISAMKQCDNPWLPTIHDVVARHALPSLLKAVKLLDYTPVVASERRPDMTLNMFKNNNPKANICVIIGCEGGFEDSEFGFLESNGVVAVKVSNNILRAETAAICAVAQVINA
jgi:16S rRNA (uracil1498-N3)-methyltransferase